MNRLVFPPRPRSRLPSGGSTCDLHRAALPLHHRRPWGGRCLNTAEAGKASKHGTPFRLFTLMGEYGKIALRKTAPEADVRLDIWMAEIEPETDPRAIAIDAAWNPRPRHHRVAARCQKSRARA